MAENETRGNTVDETGPDDIDSSVLRHSFGLARGPEHDQRVIEQWSRWKATDLHLRLRGSRVRKYKLVQSFPELEQRREIHPRWNALQRIEREIRLLEAAIERKQNHASLATVEQPARAPLSWKELIDQKCAEKGWSIQDFANHVGVDHKTIFNLRKGQTRHPRAGTRKKIADALGMSVKDLLK
jgi:DNA-binding Xre family transcriptional regulator